MLRESENNRIVRVDLNMIVCTFDVLLECVLNTSLCNDNTLNVRT